MTIRIASKLAGVAIAARGAPEAMGQDSSNTIVGHGFYWVDPS